MKKQKHTQSPSIETIKLGVDVHADFHVVSVQEDGSSPQRGRRVRSDEFLDFVKEQQKRAGKVVSCYEAGPFGYVLHRQLAELGVDNLVVCPRLWDEGSKAGKTDKLDALALCQRLDRYHGGNTKAFDVVTVPSEEQERRRVLPRQRAQFAKLRKSAQSMGRTLLLSQGVRASGRWWEGKAWERLQRSCPKWLLEAVQAYVPTIEAADRAEREAAAELGKRAAGRRRPKGLGALTDECVEAEVFDWGRFSNRRQVGGYSGLCPSERSSGKSRRLGSVSKRGNVPIRTLAVEAAWRLKRYQPGYPPLAKRMKVLCEGTAAQKKKAIVAVARKLLVDMWRVRSGQCDWEDLGLECS